MNIKLITHSMVLIFVSAFQSMNCNDYVYNIVDINETYVFLKNLIPDKSLVFDVGANIGKKAEFYLACGAKVVCFEPQFNCVNELANKFGKNPDVSIEYCGLAKQPGILELKVCDQVSTLSTFNKQCTTEGRFAERNYTWSRIVQVPVTTLDEMIKKHGVPHFCKIDVEGFEYEVLQGLTQKINTISFECNSEYMDVTKKCVKYLESIGYQKFNFAIGERAVFAFDSWYSADAFISELEKLAHGKSWSDIWGLWGDVYANAE